MIYIIVTILLIIFMLFYIKIADRYNIVDKPNERSSHTITTIRGGGLIFWFSALLYFVFHYKTNYLFFTGITIVSFISFYDDIKSLPNKVRALVQVVALSIIFHDLNLLQTQPLWIILIAYILSVGIINAYNFMDGINGITGIYTLVVLLSFYYVNNYGANNSIANFEDNDFFIFPMIACIIFLFFNYRKKAKCFAGDVGSISIAFLVIYLMVKLILVSGSMIWLLFLAVYGVDTICTILHRLYLKQNIFKAHRLHFYQILCNERKIDHRIISFGYGAMQAIISLIVIMLYGTINTTFIWIIVIIPLILIYSLKFKLRNNESPNNKR